MTAVFWTDIWVSSVMCIWLCHGGHWLVRADTFAWLFWGDVLSLHLHEGSCDYMTSTRGIWQLSLSVNEPATCICGTGLLSDLASYTSLWS
jgi:hypothetical protein